MPTTRSVPVLAALMLLVAGAACGGGDAGPDAASGTTGPPTSVVAPPGGGVQNLLATLSGEAEVPGPGVADATGSASLQITGPKVCYIVKMTLGETPTKGHIHKGGPTEAGPVVVDLEIGPKEEEAGFVAVKCVISDADKVAEITANPAGFYVNIHTAEHPDGAMRGQLAGK